MAARGEGGREDYALSVLLSYRREILIIYNIFPCYVLAPSFSARYRLAFVLFP